MNEPRIELSPIHYDPAPHNYLRLVKNQLLIRIKIADITHIRPLTPDQRGRRGSELVLSSGQYLHVIEPPQKVEAGLKKEQPHA